MLILAPMQGLTELLFRRAFHRCFPGAFDYAISPFISLTHGNLRDAEKKLTDVLPQNNRDAMPLIPQILGYENAEFVDLANRLFDLGYQEVNWNLGCPMRRVAHKHRGSGMLPYPDEIRSVLEYVLPRIKPSLSVKIRLGYYCADEIDAVVPVLNDFPLDNVTIHPRIGKQMYSGRPDLQKLQKVLPSVHHRVIYNGDVFSVADYKKIRLLFPSVNHVMIGRGALYNPMLPIQIRQQCPEDFPLSDKLQESFQNAPSIPYFIQSLMEDILQMDISHQAKGRKMKEYWCLLSRALPGTEARKRHVLHADRLEDIHRLILEMAK